MTTDEVVRALASMTDAEFAAVTEKARNPRPAPEPASTAEAIAAAEKAGNWPLAGALKAARLTELRKNP